MRIEPEWCNAKRQDGHPEVQQIRRPQRQRHIEQHDKRPDTQIDRRPCETREKCAKVIAGRRESTTGGDVSSASKSEIAEDRVCVNLGREDFENGG